MMIDQLVIFGIIFLIAFLAGMILGSIGTIPKQFLDKQADKSRIYCKVNKSYIWVTKEEYIRLFLTDQGE
jgi:hypothetical protein